MRRALNDPEAKTASSLTRKQADAILAMRLQQLTGLEADKLTAEYLGLRSTSLTTNAFSATNSVILDLIRTDLRELKDKVRRPTPEPDLR